MRCWRQPRPESVADRDSICKSRPPPCFCVALYVQVAGVNAVSYLNGSPPRSAHCALKNAYRAGRSKIQNAELGASFFTKLSRQ